MSGIANLRYRLTIDAPPLDLNIGGEELGRQVAERVADRLRELYAQGLDAHGTALPALKPSTLQRRRRRIAQTFVSDAWTERFRVRGGPNRSKAYKPYDRATPFHESGIASDNVAVQFKGKGSGQPVWLIAWASGGKSRGLTLDDGRGARLFAVQHYGFERMADIPRDLDSEIEKLLDVHLEAVIRQAGSIAGQLHRIASRAIDIVEQGAEGEPEE